MLRAHTHDYLAVGCRIFTLVLKLECKRHREEIKAFLTFQSEPRRMSPLLLGSCVFESFPTNSSPITSMRNHNLSNASCFIDKLNAYFLWFSILCRRNFSYLFLGLSMQSVMISTNLCIVSRQILKSFLYMEQ